MSNLFSGINARLRGVSARSPTSPTPPLPEGEGQGPGQGPGQGLGLGQGQSAGAGASQAPLGPGPTAAGQSLGTQVQASQSSSSLTRLPPLPNSPSLAQSIGMMSTAEDVLNSYHLPRPLPLWLSPSYQRHIVKGNFTRLSTRPKTVEPGEWIASQVVEQFRNLWNFVRVVHDKEDDNTSLCNARTCPRMSAGTNHTYTWLNSRLEPIELPAYEYITLMQRWINGKITDDKIFPTDPAGVSYAANPSLASTGGAAGDLTGGPDEWTGKRSGFPRDFFGICQTIFLQMFRVYAHLYWAHFAEPFYCLNLEKQLNSCFSHFVLTATALDMLKQRELEPMQPLIDLWAADGTFPQESKAYEYANLQVGKHLLHLSGAALPQQ